MVLNCKNWFKTSLNILCALKMYFSGFIGFKSHSTDASWFVSDLCLDAYNNKRCSDFFSPGSKSFESPSQDWPQPNHRKTVMALLLFEMPHQRRSDVPFLIAGWYLHPLSVKEMTRGCALFVLTGSATQLLSCRRCTNQQGMNFGRGILYSWLKLSQYSLDQKKSSSEEPVSNQIVRRDTGRKYFLVKNLSFHSCFCTKWMESYKGFQTYVLPFYVQQVVYQQHPKSHLPFFW